MSSHVKSKSKTHAGETEAHAEAHEGIEDIYEPQIEAVGRIEFDSMVYGHVVAEMLLWSDSRFTEMTMNVYRLEPKGMAMTTYRPILIGSYPVPNRKH